MSATTFDTLRAAKDLEAAGVPASHAEAIARTIRHSAAADLAQFATKADIAHFATKQDLASLETSMTKLVLSAILASIALTTGFTVALVKLL